ncbi:MAG: plasmid maintenance protein CcdB [Gammaproteobacteria bacterium RIFCSPLOWO2_02_FULL_61_13]|nr:MAG: plasmid maintenance protein CcdB [Gammaproteobacteria bacterium RIFCSPLOWO2_02_FULL_61_13]
MPQFAIHRNPNPATKTTAPYLLDIQSDLISDLNTRVVVPFHAAAAMKGKTLTTLTPVFTVEGKQFVMMTPQLAGIAKKKLGAKISDLSSQRDKVIAALDLLITGI